MKYLELIKKHLIQKACGNANCDLCKKIKIGCGIILIIVILLTVI
jgi:hypothetical protein